MYLWIGIVHIIIFPILPILFIVFAPIELHKYIFVYIGCIVLLWLICKDECIISYIYKKLNDPLYALGDTFELTDIIDVCKYSNITAILYILVLLYGIYLVYICDSLSTLKCVLFFSIVSIYVAALYFGGPILNTHLHLRTIFDILKIPYAAIVMYIALV